VACDRFDSTGVWGTLPDWGPKHNVYLPLGSVVRNGRGQRKRQADFLAKTKKFIAKKRPMQVVAEVKTVEMKSSRGVDELIDGFEITASRQLVSEEEELQTKAESQWIQKAATLIVDKAAATAGVSRSWARQVALYDPYYQSLKETNDDEGEDKETDNEPEYVSAAKHFLVNKVGRLQDSTVVASLIVPDSLQHGQDMNHGEVKFARELLKLCKKEVERTAQPTSFSLTELIGGPQSVLKAKAEPGAPKAVCGVTLAKAVLEPLLDEETPEGFSPLEITVAGAGKFKFTIIGPKTSKEGMVFLNDVLSKAREKWKRVASLPEEAASEHIGGEASGIADENNARCSQIRMEEQPDFNIGIIGDVANGKSTMVHAMSGKRTQAHSSEQQKHGMTIRLGFANAAVACCRDEKECGSYFFLSESDMADGKDLFCQTCKERNADIVKRVSFIDCPGHAELMTTMLGGCAAFDAALFVAAANAPCPSPQARQHLEAIKSCQALSDKGRVAIVQTKAELIAKQAQKNLGGLSASDLLAHHANAATEQLKRTVAANSPFFPACAPRGLGLQPIAKWLASLPSNTSTLDKTAHRLFRVLRSFDVNRVGTNIKNMGGGVLGGTISGPGVIHKGDILEVRPGLLVGMKPNSDVEDESKTEEVFDVRPLQLRCEGIMTGKTPLTTAKSGGLVALQTDLNPSLCADDRLVGAVVGPSDMLPPVWGPAVFLDGLELIDIGAISSAMGRRSLKERLKKGRPVVLHCGSSTVPGVVKRISLKQGKVEVHMKQPLCAFQNFKIAIEAEERPGLFSLVAHATLRDGTCCYDGANEPKNDSSIQDSSTEAIRDGNEDDDSIEDDQIRRVRFLEELQTTKHQVDSDAAGAIRVSVPSPQLERDGGQVLISNFAAIARALNREPVHLQRYVQKEGGLSGVPAGERGSGLRVKWKRRGGMAELFDKILYRYCRDFVACPQCGGAKTELLKATSSKDGVEQQCCLCNARRFVPKI